MTAIPGHLLDIAVYADHTDHTGRSRLDLAVAAAILLCLPPEDPYTRLGRRVAAEAEMHPSGAYRRRCWTT